MSIQPRPLTFEDLLDTPDDGYRYEIIDGEMIVSPAPGRKHQSFSGLLFLLVATHVRSNNLGEVFFAPVDVRLHTNDIVQPDLIFIRRDRLDIYQDNPVEGPPDLVVEIISPTSVVRDAIRKARLYAASGVREYWLADPVKRTFQLFVLRDGRYEDVAPIAGLHHSTVVDGLIIDAAALFAQIR